MTTRWGVDYSALEDEHGLPPGLLYAVEMTESRGNPEAVSPAGATGAFQLMPATARELKTDPYDPAQSAVAAAHMLGRLTRQYAGDVERALQAYNFGEGNLAKGKPLPKETREYVPKVLGRLPDGGFEYDIYGRQPQAAPAAAPADFEADLYGQAPAVQPQAAPVDFEADLYGSAPAGRSEDVPAGIGEPGYAGRPAGMDRDVPWPEQTGLSDLPERPEGLQVQAERFYSGLARKPVRAVAEALGHAGEAAGIDFPDALQRNPDESFVEYLARQGQEEKARLGDGFSAAELAGAALSPAQLLIPGGGGFLPLIGRGMASAALVPTDNPDNYLQDKALQIGAGGVASAALGGLARGAGHLAGAVKGKMVPGVDELAKLAKTYDVPISAEDLARARTDKTLFTKLRDLVTVHAERRLEGLPFIGKDRSARLAASQAAQQRAVNEAGEVVHDIVSRWADDASAPIFHTRSASPQDLVSTIAKMQKWLPDDARVQGLSRLVDHIQNSQRLAERTASTPASRLGAKFNQAALAVLGIADPTSTASAAIGGHVLFNTEAGHRLLFAANLADEAGLDKLVQQMVVMAAHGAGQAAQPPVPVDFEADLYGEPQR